MTIVQTLIGLLAIIRVLTSNDRFFDKTCGIAIPPPSQEAGEDQFLWIQANGSYGTSFSSTVTWECIRDSSPIQSWHKVIWFKEHIPRNSFISWLVLRRRLPTRDRLRRWGMTVPEECVLCSAAPETHHHLFFECTFSASIWNYYAGKVWPNPPADIHSAAAWINFSRSSSTQERCIIKLIFQSSIYVIWKERNLRIFTGQVAPSLSARAALDRQIRDRLLSVKPSQSLQPSFLQVFFACTKPP